MAPQGCQAQDEDPGLSDRRQVQGEAHTPDLAAAGRAVTGAPAPHARRCAARQAGRRLTSHDLRATHAIWAADLHGVLVEP